MKVETIATGGGKKPKPLDPAVEKVLAISEEGTEISSPYDCESARARKADILAESLVGILGDDEFNQEISDDDDSMMNRLEILPIT